MFELSLRHRQGPTKIGVIAAAQSIPVRFLELILSQLKHGGFVASRRGAKGGYVLSVPPGELTVGRIIDFVDGPVAPIGGTVGDSGAEWDPAFMDMWNKVHEAVAQSYEATTFADLIDQHAGRGRDAGMYCI